jgi:hypothetical protein
MLPARIWHSQSFEEMPTRITMLTGASRQPAAAAAAAVMRLRLNSTRPSSGCRRLSRHRCQSTSRTADRVLSLLCTGAPPAHIYRPLAPHCARFPPLVPRCLCLRSYQFPAMPGGEAGCRQSRVGPVSIVIIIHVDHKTRGRGPAPTYTPEDTRRGPGCGRPSGAQRACRRTPSALFAEARANIRHDA